MDPTAHAEMEANQHACSKPVTFNWKVVPFTPPESGLMCFGAIYQAKSYRLIYVATRHEATVLRFDNS